MKIWRQEAGTLNFEAHVRAAGFGWPGLDLTAHVHPALILVSKLEKAEGPCTCSVLLEGVLERSGLSAAPPPHQACRFSAAGGSFFECGPANSETKPAPSKLVA